MVTDFETIGLNMHQYSNIGMIPFSEPDWNIPHHASISGLDYENSEPYSTSTARTNVSRQPPPVEISALPSHMVNIPRPKSSPSTFGANVEDLVFPENPFRLANNDDFQFPDYLMAQEKSSTGYINHTEYQQELHQPVAIQPSPAMRQASVGASPSFQAASQFNMLKRVHEDDDVEYGAQRRKRAHSAVERPMELNEEEALLLRLKEEENLPWKDIAARFQSELGKAYQVPALQMRFKRLRERMRTWTDADVQALEQAFDYWEKYQFEIISAKMLDFGVTERWPAKYCLRKWDELHPNSVTIRAPYPMSYENSPNVVQGQWDATNQQSRHSTPLPVDAMGHSPNIGMMHSPNPTVAQMAHNPNVTMAPTSNSPYYAAMSPVPHATMPVGLGMVNAGQRLSPPIHGQGLPVGMSRRPSMDHRLSVSTVRSQRLSSE